MIGDFHFIRPWWLLALLPAVWLILALIRRSRVPDGWSEVMDPELFAALEVKPEGDQAVLKPIHVLSFMWVVMIGVMAGPTWKLIPSPLAEESSALVIVMKVSESMEVRDIQPSRLKRAQQKVEDLMEFRRGTDHGLIAYSGSAHRVMPITKDPGIIVSFVQALDPTIMPTPGESGLGQAIELAAAELERTGKTGSILVIADDILPQDLEEALEVKRNTGVIVHIYGIGNQVEGSWNPGTLQQAARQLGGAFVEIQPDIGDMQLVAEIASSEIGLVGEAQEGQQWAEMGYWLIPFLVLGSLLWFRSGWNVDYS